MLNRVAQQEARATTGRSVVTGRPDTPWPVSRPNEPRQAAYPNLRRGGPLPKKGYNHHKKVGNGVRQRAKAVLTQLMQEVLDEHRDTVKARYEKAMLGSDLKTFHTYFKMTLEHLEGLPIHRIRVSSPQRLIVVMDEPEEAEEPDG